MTLAAESLGLTQPGVSGAIKRLQQYLGKDLFVREGQEHITNIPPFN
ncbi:helix-turn-helix domain-containing protein [Photobacterium leiognathi]